MISSKKNNLNKYNIKQSNKKVIHIKKKKI